MRVEISNRSKSVCGFNRLLCLVPTKVSGFFDPFVFVGTAVFEKKSSILIFAFKFNSS